ncbi:PREDICTED: cytochrome P450 9e2-like isoform X2 [Nicrophorus vespilloides]|uniref:Cytochrome P450 9e2-like isoform X2 n=1 Tax=Nicrophorus vespilloides TaxID=110193 RepID=A0ABM1M6L3_NICVS|nr:PREDICTED: cytochrome P450 9e2-like isoform X2 [Nicrophorus vespilloides]
MLFVLISCVLLVFIFWKLMKRQTLWRQRNVTQGTAIPIFGDSWKTFLKQESFVEMVQRKYNEFPSARYTGIYRMSFPTLMIRDPELITRIAIKDFDHFTDHRTFFSDQADPLWNKNLFSLRGEKWKEMRAILSPVFTGSKMRLMFDLMKACSDQFVAHFLERSDVVLEVSDAFTSQRTSSMPWKFKFSIFSRKVGDFFKGLVKENIEMREVNGIKRNDLINLLMEARKKELSHEDITAQALVFFFAGFDSVSTLMSFLAYELALNPEVQDKLRDEIDETLISCKGNLRYEDLQSMKYLDMVIAETLRKWPSTFVVDRVCVKPYTIPALEKSESDLHLNAGDVLWLPIFGIQRDPNYYTDPERFDPERFNDENKGRIGTSTYIPFGLGPRNCIGSRFALLETKLLFIQILSNFKIEVDAETTVPLKLDRHKFGITSEGGFWLGFKSRRRSK